MQILTSIQAMRSASRAVRYGANGTARGRVPTLGLVPTMGALHEGHLALVRAAKESCDCVAVSIFVNPTQFGPNEDFTKYPRTFERDCELLEREEVAFLFAPPVGEMNPAAMNSGGGDSRGRDSTGGDPRDRETWVEVPGIGSRLDGASRPRHFRGVATVVTKLFHIVQPDRAFFGQKDAAQVAVLRAMVRDLNFDVELVVCPTVREGDGLALSSRNRFLDAREREQALALSRSLREVERTAAEGQRDAAALRAVLLGGLQSADGIRLDYAEVVDADTLEPVSDVREGALVAVAAWVGSTRLIDNVVLAPEFGLTSEIGLTPEFAGETGEGSL